MAKIFSSSAKYMVLRTLYAQESFIPLRHIGYLAGIYVYSVQRAVKDLVSLGLIEKKKNGRETHYRINEDHCLFPSIRAIFRDEVERDLKKRAQGYGNLPERSLKFSCAFNKMFSKSQKSLTWT